MTERELFELAAKAAMLPECGWMGPAFMYVKDNTFTDWNPRDDDGDSFRLACDVGLNVYPHARTMDGGACSAVGTPSDGRLSEVADASLDTRAATRLAILRAAAEIGKAMP
jgi:hypothetical protein